MRVATCQQLMDYFGDESGHLKGVLQGDCDVCVVGVVGGVKYKCMRCPKRAVDRVDDLEEARWTDMFDTQKRRFLECIADLDLEFGYVAFDQDKLHTMDNYHYLYQDVSFPPAWDLVLAGYAYGEVLYEMGAPDEHRAIFTVDRISSRKQTEKMIDHVCDFVPGVNPFIAGSKGSKGVQAADCLSGAIAEDMRKGTEWRSYLDDLTMIECTATSLAKLETDLSELK